MRQKSLLGIIILSYILLSSTVGIQASVKSIQEKDPFSIILMIGDGMGFEQVKLARWVEKGVEGQLDMETLPYSANVTTNSLDSTPTDSAAAATAIATGNKTENGFVSMTPERETLKTILEYAVELGKSTGIITTTQVYHGTPATFYSHMRSRNLYLDIVNQLTNESKVDLVLGGGQAEFKQESITSMIEKGYSYVEDRQSLSNVENSKVLGLFAHENIPNVQDRNKTLTPSLVEMTEKSLEILSQDNDGFFLMVEGGLIDWSSHANNIFNTALETIEFNEAVRAAFSYAQNHSNTLLIVTADHETGGLTIVSEALNTTLPFPLNNTEENGALRLLRAGQINCLWEGTSHTAADVPFFGFGDSLANYNGKTIDNTEIFSMMYDHFYSDQASSTPGFWIGTSWIILIFFYIYRKSHRS
ncbi:MAG: alkaline phosphatase [Candidatus Hodarchaeota archaeon]